MKRTFIACLILSLFGFIFSSTLQAQEVTGEKLQALSKEIFKIHNTQNTEAFLALIHPSCPELPDWRIAASMEAQWIHGPNNDIRYKTIDEAYEPSTWDFKVPAIGVIEFQVMTKRGDEQIELVTGYPVALYQGELKVLEYPCMEPKQ